MLWVKAGRLLPVDTGGKLRSYHLARALAARHDLTMLTYYEGPADPAYEREMGEHFPGAATMRTGPMRPGGLTDVARYAANLLSRVPFAVAKFSPPEVMDLVDRWTREDCFDAIVCDFLSATRNFTRPESTPVVLFQHNVESALWRRQARHAPNPVLRLVYGIESWKMDRYEARTVARFREVIAVSEEDRRLMSGMTDPSRIVVVPTGVDTAKFAAVAETEPTSHTALFLGSMDWEPNVDGVEWMTSSVWPRIVQAVPEARFAIVGRNPHPSVRAKAAPGIVVTGSVPSVEPYLREADAFIVPLRVGGGTRLKIFEAMAAGRAVISTTVGAEGLPVTHDRDILIADDPEAFASAVIRVMTDPALRQRIAAGGLALARAHDWSQVVSGFADVLARAGAGPGTRRGVV